MRLKIVEILWGDAFIETDDFKPEDAKNTEPCYRRTVGYLIARNKHGYVLSTDRYEKQEDGVAAKMFIPKGMVIKVTYLVPK